VSTGDIVSKVKDKSFTFALLFLRLDKASAVHKVRNTFTSVYNFELVQKTKKKTHLAAMRMEIKSK